MSKKRKLTAALGKEAIDLLLAGKSHKYVAATLKLRRKEVGALHILKEMRLGNLRLNAKFSESYKRMTGADLYTKEDLRLLLTVTTNELERLRQLPARTKEERQYIRRCKKNLKYLKKALRAGI